MEMFAVARAGERWERPLMGQEPEVGPGAFASQLHASSTASWTYKLFYERRRFVSKFALFGLSRDRTQAFSVSVEISVSAETFSVSAETFSVSVTNPATLKSGMSFTVWQYSSGNS